jgi:carbon monoxide dehydrogenase subunit G
MAVGTRYESRYRFFGREETVVTELTEAAPARRLAWRQVGRGSLAINDGDYQLEPVGGKTRLTVHGVIESHGLARLLDAPFAAYLRRASKKQLAQLAAAMS